MKFQAVLWDKLPLFKSSPHRRQLSMAAPIPCGASVHWPWPTSPVLCWPSIETQSHHVFKEHLTLRIPAAPHSQLCNRFSPLPVLGPSQCEAGPWVPASQALLPPPQWSTESKVRSSQVYKDITVLDQISELLVALATAKLVLSSLSPFPFQTKEHTKTTHPPSYSQRHRLTQLRPGVGVKLKLMICFTTLITGDRSNLFPCSMPEQRWQTSFLCPNKEGQPLLPWSQKPHQILNRDNNLLYCGTTTSSYLYRVSYTR